MMQINKSGSVAIPLGSNRSDGRYERPKERNEQQTKPDGCAPGSEEIR
jgi:hypothetical protein